MEQSSILSAKSDCPVTGQNVLHLATVQDCETGFWAKAWVCPGIGQKSVAA